MLTPATKDVDLTETHESRIKKPNVSLPSVVELRIDSNNHFRSDWPRAVDLIDCCPNLKRVNLTGGQYLTDDLMNLPATIERIEYGFLSTDEEVAKLKETFSRATVERRMKGMHMVALSIIPWDIAETRVNRRRKLGWRDSQFALTGTLDLSETEIDMAFAELLRPVFYDTHRIVFGNFDSSETAIWVTQQCPQLVDVDTNGFDLKFTDAIQIPVSIQTLTIKQNSISADEFVKLINKLGLRILTVAGSSFNERESNMIQDAEPSCKVAFEQ